MDDKTWTGYIRTLLYPVQFDRDPRDGIDRVFVQQFGPGSTATSAQPFMDAVRTALGSDEPLSRIMPLSHTEDEVRAYLEEVLRRLEARFPPPDEAPPLAEQPRSEACAQLLDICDALREDEIGAGEFGELLDELEQWLGSEIGGFSGLDDLDLEPYLTGRDLIVAGLGMMLSAVSEARRGDEWGGLDSAEAWAKEADKLILQGHQMLREARKFLAVPD